MWEQRIRWTQPFMMCPPDQSVNSELMSMVHIWIVVFGDYHSVSKLAASERLHGFLTFCSRNILHENLEKIE